MAIAEQTAHSRAGIGLAKIRHICSVSRQRLIAYLRRRPPGMKQLNDHLIRDIGLKPADIERLRHQWPSQSTHHPRG